MKSQCCNADIEKDLGGVGVFSLTTGSLICQKCKKYCCYTIENVSTQIDIDDPHCTCNRCREKRTITE